MFDSKDIKNNPKLYEAGWKKRGAHIDLDAFLTLDDARRQCIKKLQEQQQAHKKNSTRSGDATNDATRAREQKAAIQALRQQEKDLTDQWRAALLSFPNLPHDDVPEGLDESSNKEISRHGTRGDFSFTPRDHDSLGEKLRLMDFAAAAAMSGSRFVVLKGALARLERALANFMMDLHTQQFGFLEVIPPHLVQDKALIGSGQLPKFAQELFSTQKNLWLIPTAEVPLINLVREQILQTATLPMRLTALTPCYRAEAGASGKDTRGMIRQHQFSKVELVSIVPPAHGEKELEYITMCAETVLQKLKLPYRAMLLCAGDMGVAARKTIDLEVWMPGQNAYREIASCSFCGDFQTRRMNTRWRGKGDKTLAFPETLNGSGLAIGRTLIAIMENYQQEDGTITVPDVLVNYMGGVRTITPL